MGRATSLWYLSLTEWVCQSQIPDLCDEIQAKEVLHKQTILFKWIICTWTLQYNICIRSSTSALLVLNAFHTSKFTESFGTKLILGFWSHKHLFLFYFQKNCKMKSKLFQLCSNTKFISLIFNCSFKLWMQIVINKQRFVRNSHSLLKLPLTRSRLKY